MLETINHNNKLDDKACSVMAATIMERCRALAKISASDTELTRTYLSKEHKAANALVGTWMQQAGMQVWQDAVGNICGRYEGTKQGKPAILLGSHLDTVKNAGRFDGILGVVAAIEVVDFLHKNNICLDIAVEVIGFADEEGTRFGAALMGSYGISGQFQQDWLDICDENNVTMANAMQEFGLNIDNIAMATRPLDSILAYLELHIEQGPCLEKENLAVGVVTAINGARRLNINFKGMSGHAGTVPMEQRQDALSSAAEWILAVENLTKKAQNGLVATVGQIHCHPNAVNVIAGNVDLSLDIRGSEDAKIDALLQELLAKGEEIAKNRHLTFAAQEYYRIKATPCDGNLQNILQKAVLTAQTRCISLPSGAGHDAIALGKNWPIAMLFLRCYKGISHHPSENINQSDVAIAIKSYIQAVLMMNKK